MAGLTAPALIKERDPIVSAIYNKLVQELRSVGPFDVEEKKTSLHFARGSAFAGVHPRAKGILLNIRHAEPIKSQRFRKVEQVSKNRYHSEVLLENPDQVDHELIGWLKDAYSLSGK